MSASKLNGSKRQSVNQYTLLLSNQYKRNVWNPKPVPMTSMVTCLAIRNVPDNIWQNCSIFKICKCITFQWKKFWSWIPLDRHFSGHFCFVRHKMTASVCSLHSSLGFWQTRLVPYCKNDLLTSFYSNSLMRNIFVSVKGALGQRRNVNHSHSLWNKWKNHLDHVSGNHT